MASFEDFSAPQRPDPVNLEVLQARYLDRLQSSGSFSEAFKDSFTHILTEFSKIALQVMEEERGDEISEAEKAIGLELFLEGIYTIGELGSEQGLDEDPFIAISQKVAWDVYKQAKQIVETDPRLQHPDTRKDTDEQPSMASEKQKEHIRTVAQSAFESHYQQV